MSDHTAPVPRWGPLVAALSTWFLHFMACWAAAEVWPQGRAAHAAAAAATALAWAALAWQWWRLRRGSPLPGWQRRFAHGAIALAAVAVLFDTLPALLLRP